MSGDSPHPITTPKGASALSILLAVVGVFAPFLFDLHSAALFGCLAIFVIVWTYWADIRATFSGFWSANLWVPTLCVIAIILMGVFLSNHTPPKPQQAVPAIDTDAIANKVWARLQQREAASPRGKSGAPKKIPVVRASPPLPAVPGPSGKSAPAPTTPSADNAPWTRLYADLAASQAKRNAYQQCHDKLWPVELALVGFAAEAGGYQNGWAYRRDGDETRKQYLKWLGEVRSYFADHKDVLPDTSGFEQVQDLDMDPTLFIIPNSGANAWRNFDNRRKALIAIEQEFGNNMCKAESEAMRSR